MNPNIYSSVLVLNACLCALTAGVVLAVKYAQLDPLAGMAIFGSYCAIQTIGLAFDRLHRWRRLPFSSKVQCLRCPAVKRKHGRSSSICTGGVWGG